MREAIKKWVVLGLAISVLSLPVVASAEEEEEVRPSASLDVAALSKYVWRGIDFSEDSLVIQPSATVEYKGFSMNLWGNLDTDFKGTDQSEFNETDWTLAYDTSVGDFDLGVGYIYYALEGVNDPEEIYAYVTAAAIPLSPTVTVYRDVTEFIGWYVNFGVSHSFDLGHDISLDLAGSVGYYDSDDDGFTSASGNNKYEAWHDVLLSVGMTIPLDKYFTISPMIAYSSGLSSGADRYIEANGVSGESTHIFGGVTLSLAF